MREILVGLDLETTGIDIEKDEPVQSALVYATLDQGVFSCPQVLFNGYSNPSVPLQEEAQKVHGISLEMVRFAPSPRVTTRTMSLLIKAVESKGSLFTYGYNSATFDIPILSRFEKSFFEHNHVDLYTLCLRELHTYGLKLTELYLNYVGKEPDSAHDAAADILLTFEVLQTYLKATGKTMSQLHKELAVPKVYSVFPFGKYKGRSVSAVPSSYANWCLKKFTNVAPDLLMTLNYIATK